MMTTVLVSALFTVIVVVAIGGFILLRDHFWGAQMPLSASTQWLGELAIGFRGSRMIVRVPGPMSRFERVQIRKVFPDRGLAYVVVEVSVDRRTSNAEAKIRFLATHGMDRTESPQRDRVATGSLKFGQDLSSAIVLVHTCLVECWGAMPHTVVRVRRIGLFRVSQPDVPNWDTPLESLGSIARRWLRR